MEDTSDDELRMLAMEISRLPVVTEIDLSAPAGNNEGKGQQTLVRCTLLQRLEIAYHRQAELKEVIRIAEVRRHAVESGLVESPTRVWNLGECPLCHKEIPAPQIGSVRITPRFACCGTVHCITCAGHRARMSFLTQRDQYFVCPICRGDFPKSKEEASQMVMGHAKAGRAWAQNELGRVLHENDDPDWLHWLTKAADLGDHDAMAALASAWHSGDTVPKSDHRAWELGRIPARHGHHLAQSICGLVKAKRGEYAEAVQWFTLAAAQGHPQMQLKLGIVFQGKTPLMKSSPFTAHYWLQKAAMQDCREAQSRMSVLVTEIAKIVSQGNTNDRGYCPLPESHFWSQLASRNEQHRDASSHLLDVLESDTCVTCHMKRSATVTLQRCAQCQVFGYCSKECQVIHWKNGHKLDCNRVKELKRKLHNHSA
jgi:TPR repeat protein